jgi:hypothetical protein
LWGLGIRIRKQKEKCNAPKIILYFVLEKSWVV